MASVVTEAANKGDAAVSWVEAVAMVAVREVAGWWEGQAVAGSAVVTEMVRVAMEVVEMAVEERAAAVVVVERVVVACAVRKAAAVRVA